MRKVALVLLFAALACRQPEDRSAGQDRQLPATPPAQQAGSGTAPAVSATPQPPPAPPLPTAVSPFPEGMSGTLVFESDREGRPKIYTLDLANGRVRRLTEGSEWRDEHPRWSPDGKRITFASTRHGSFDIFVMNADGTGAERLTDHEAIEHDPTWAPDGRSIVFSGERDGRGELYRVWPDTKKVDRLTAGFDRAIMPAVSPDGRSVSYAGQTVRYFQIHVADAGGAATETVQMTSGEPACRPAWSPDGQQIAYVLGQDPSRLGVMSVATKEARTLLSHPKLWLYYPSYSPDARHLAFSVSPEHHRGEDWDLAVVSTASPESSFQRLTVGPGNDRLPHWRLY
jgi:Tol biopolymer transport system component